MVHALGSHSGRIVAVLIILSIRPSFAHASVGDVCDNHMHLSVLHESSGRCGPSQNLEPGEVEIAQYGALEAEGSFKSAGFQVVRFDPPFGPPYTITKITFASATANGVPAVFPSVRLCAADPTTGTPLLSAPLFQLAPYSGSADGVNEIPTNITVSDSGRIFYWCVEFPSRFSAEFPNNYPFLRMDVDMERGYFENSFEINPFGRLSNALPLRNLIVSMFCRPSSEDGVPIEATSNLGGNRIGTGVEFTFTPPKDRRADGTAMHGKALLRTEVLRRTGPQAHWQPWASSEGRRGKVFVDSLTSVLGGSWTTQAIDRNGNRAITSSVILLSPFFSDAYPDEPNGNRAEATPLTLPMEPRSETIVPAGDQDFFSFLAGPGDVIAASAGVFAPGSGRPDLVMFLLDRRGKVVASDDNSLGFGNPGIRYAVPLRRSKDIAPQEFTLRISEIGGSVLSPLTAPREFLSPGYLLNVRLNPEPVALTLGYSSGQNFNAEGFGFRIAGQMMSPRGTRFVFVLPPQAEGERVSLRVYDVQGRLVCTLVDQTERGGPHTVVWDGTGDQGTRMASGVYYARLTAGSLQASEKVVLMR